MGGRVKKGSGKNRGYIGYHITWDNKRVFLRSKSEFILAKMLDMEKIPYLTEYKSYKINNISYKPDFFIFNDINYTNIIKIINAALAYDYANDDEACQLTDMIKTSSVKDAFKEISLIDREDILVQIGV